MQRDMRIPLEFITFAFVEAKMYKHFKNDSVFLLQPDNRKWGNNVVYGALYTLRDFEFYIRNLDAFHICSLSTLRTNHIKDIHHRVITSATPINFASLNNFSRLLYKEGSPIDVQTYVGNPNHPKIQQRLNKTISYRLTDGVDIENFKKTWEEQHG